MSNWVGQSALVDRDWQADDRLIYGFYGQSPLSTAAEPFGAVALFAGATRDLVVRKIDFGAQIGRFAAQAHVATIGGSYNPVAVSAGRFFPFCHTAVQDTSLPAAICVGGLSPTLAAYSLQVDPPPAPPFLGVALGPLYNFKSYTNFGAGSLLASQETILDWDDPPLIIPANASIYVQHLAVTPGFTMDVNFWVSERETA